MPGFWYYFGRALQIASLIALPSAIWAGQLAHDERGAIAILVSSVALFAVGYFLTRVRRKL